MKALVGRGGCTGIPSAAVAVRLRAARLASPKARRVFFSAPGLILGDSYRQCSVEVLSARAGIFRFFREPYRSRGQAYSMPGVQQDYANLGRSTFSILDNYFPNVSYFKKYASVVLLPTLPLGFFRSRTSIVSSLDREANETIETRIYHFGVCRSLFSTESREQ